MTEPLAINYRDFWDVPRIFFVHRAGRLYLFDCQFDRELEDYPEVYRVFLMPPLTAEDYAGSWAELWQRAVETMGEVPVSAIRFDPTRRAAIDAAAFDAVKPALATANPAKDSPF